MQTVTPAFLSFTIPLFHKMNPQERECPQCGGPVEGRANKVFCSAVCRAQHFRDMAAESPAYETTDAGHVVALVPKPSPTTEQPTAAQVEAQAAAARSWENFFQNELNRQEAARIRREAEKWEDLHSDYCSAVTDCLKADSTALDKYALERKIEELDKLSARYRKHPGLQQPGGREHLRLEDIYWLHDTLRDLLKELKSKYRPGYPSQNTVLLEFTTKCRAQLRANMLSS